MHSDASSDDDMVADEGSDHGAPHRRHGKDRLPAWDVKKHHHRSWEWQFYGYADSIGLGATARGKDRDQLKSTDPAVRAAYRKRNGSVFIKAYNAVDKERTAGKALRMQIETEFEEDRDGFELLNYMRAYSGKMSEAEIDKLKERIKALSFPVRKSPAKWELRCQKMHKLWLRIPEGKRDGDESELASKLLKKIDDSAGAYVDYIRALGRGARAP